jgi:hypothetical protein
MERDPGRMHRESDRTADFNRKSGNFRGGGWSQKEGEEMDGVKQS